MDAYKIEREQVCAAGHQLLERGLVEGTWGNCSLRISERLMAITPSGRRYEDLAPDDIVIMDYHSLEVFGTRKPSSEKSSMPGSTRPAKRSMP